MEKNIRRVKKDRRGEGRGEKDKDTRKYRCGLKHISKAEEVKEVRRVGEKREWRRQKRRVKKGQKGRRK